MIDYAGELSAAYCNTSHTHARDKAMIPPIIIIIIIQIHSILSRINFSYFTVNVIVSDANNFSRGE